MVANLAITDRIIQSVEHPVKKLFSEKIYDTHPFLRIHLPPRICTDISPTEHVNGSSSRALHW
jgi:hypothetical protein